HGAFAIAMRPSARRGQSGLGAVLAAAGRNAVANRRNGAPMARPRAARDGLVAVGRRDVGMGLSIWILVWTRACRRQARLSPARSRSGHARWSMRGRP